MNYRAVITGIGTVSSIGIGWEEFCNGIKNERKCFSFLPDNVFPKRTLTAPIANFSVDKYLRAPKAYLDRSSQFLFAAVTLALENASLPSPPIETALITGTQYASMETSAVFYRDVVEKGPRFAKPFLFPHCYSNTGISLISIEYGLKGIHLNLASGLCAGLEALYYASNLIVSGKAHIAIAGGFDAISLPILHGFYASELLSDSLNGFIPGEGAGIFIIENYDYAISRKAPIKAFIAGGGIGSTPGKAMEKTCHVTKPDYIVTSANGIKTIDDAEESAIKEIYGSHQKVMPRLFSLKKIVGETFAAGGSLNTAAAIYLLNNVNNEKVNILANSIDISGTSVCIILSNK